MQVFPCAHHARQDLYEGLVQPYFRAGMQWETWADGSPGPVRHHSLQYR